MSETPTADRLPTHDGLGTGLRRLDGFPFAVHVSPGGEEHGRAVARRMRRAVDWLDRAARLPSVPSLFVVGPEHWDDLTLGPPYGVPHLGDDRIVVGQHPAPFWTTLIDTVAPHLSPESWQRHTAAYGDPPDLGGFADLLVVHELGHLTHGPSWPDHPIGFWLQELVANVCLHGYVTEVEPEAMAVLETVYDVTFQAPADHWPVHDLHRTADALHGDGTNYVWFYFGLQILARALWQTAGITALHRILNLLQGPVQPLGDVADALGTLDPRVGRAVLNWPDLAR